MRIEIKTKTRQSGHFTTLIQNKHGMQIVAPVLTKWEIWWNENGNNRAVMPSKGRIPQFSYRQILDILSWDSIGTETQKIADMFETSYQNIYNIIIGKSCQWALEV